MMYLFWLMYTQTEKYKPQVIVNWRVDPQQDVSPDCFLPASTHFALKNESVKQEIIRLYDK